MNPLIINDTIKKTAASFPDMPTTMQNLQSSIQKVMLTIQEKIGEQENIKNIPINQLNDEQKKKVSGIAPDVMDIIIYILAYFGKNDIKQIPSVHLEREKTIEEKSIPIGSLLDTLQCYYEITLGQGIVEGLNTGSKETELPQRLQDMMQKTVEFCDNSDIEIHHQFVHRLAEWMDKRNKQNRQNDPTNDRDTSNVISFEAIQGKRGDKGKRGEREAK